MIKLPIVLCFPREEVRRFSAYMECKLRDNDHKPGWEDCPLDYLIMRLEDEVDELKQAALKTDRDPDDVLSEAADVANFAMMVAHRVRTQ